MKSKNVTTKEFNTHFLHVLQDMSAIDLVRMVPSIQSDVMKKLSNKIIDSVLSEREIDEDFS